MRPKRSTQKVGDFLLDLNLDESKYQSQLTTCSIVDRLLSYDEILDKENRYKTLILKSEIKQNIIHQISVSYDEQTSRILDIDIRLFLKKLDENGERLYLKTPKGETFYTQKMNFGLIQYIERQFERNTGFSYQKIKRILITGAIWKSPTFQFNSEIIR